jgi:hypothetical protein
MLANIKKKPPGDVERCEYGIINEGPLSRVAQWNPGTWSIKVANVFQLSCPRHAASSTHPLNDQSIGNTVK